MSVATVLLFCARYAEPSVPASSSLSTSQSRAAIRVSLTCFTEHPLSFPAASALPVIRPRGRGQPERSPMTTTSRSASGDEVAIIPPVAGG